MSNDIRLGMVNLTPTMRCNLKCKLCGVLVPHYEYCPQMTLAEFKETLQAIFRIADYVGKLQITGGEPFLYPQLAEIISNCFEYEDKFDKLWIFTNGSVPIRPEIVTILERYKDKVLIHISDYGVRREVTTELVEKVKGIGCEYRYLKYYGEQQYFDGWVDQGDFVCHNRSVAEMENVFTKCPHVSRGGSWYVRNGQMHWCGRSIRGTELAKIPLCEDDYLDIFDKNTSLDEKKEKMQELMKVKCITACNYCNGNYGTEQSAKRYPAGEQM